MTTQAILEVVLWFANLAVDATVILIFAWLVTLPIKKNAGLRHAVWVAAFVAMFVTPMVLVMSHPVREMKIEMPVAASVIKAPVPTSPASISVSSIIPPKPAPPAHLDWQKIAGVFLFLWPIGIVVAGIRMAIAAVGIRSIYRNSRPMTESEDELSQLLERLKIKRKVRLRISSRPIPPAAMTWGTWSPIILLPSSSSTWTNERREAILLHELAHIRRFDCFTQVLSTAACILLWFHPLVWQASKAMHSDAETAADDMVIRTGIRPTDYAADLVALAASFARLRQSDNPLGVSLLKKSGIENRIQSLVDPTVKRGGVSATHVVSFVLVGGLVVAGVTSFRPKLSKGIDIREQLFNDAVDMVARHVRDQEAIRKRADVLYAIEMAHNAVSVQVDPPATPTKLVVVRDGRPSSSRNSFVAMDKRSYPVSLAMDPPLSIPVRSHTMPRVASKRLEPSMLMASLPQSLSPVTEENGQDEYAEQLEHRQEELDNAKEQLQNVRENYADTLSEAKKELDEKTNSFNENTHGLDFTKPDQSAKFHDELSSLLAAKHDVMMKQVDADKAVGAAERQVGQAERAVDLLMAQQQKGGNQKMASMQVKIPKIKIQPIYVNVPEFNFSPKSNPNKPTMAR